MNIISNDYSIAIYKKIEQDLTLHRQKKIFSSTRRNSRTNKVFTMF